MVLEGGKAGGRVFLVDFGGVQAAAAGDALATGSTVIGTYGYMAPEQFRGAASPASDLYGLGGTLLFLLSGSPHEIIVHKIYLAPRRTLPVAGIACPTNVHWPLKALSLHANAIVLA